MEIKKRDIRSYSNKIKMQLNRGLVSSVYLLKDGRILKIFNEGYLSLLKQIEFDMEKKIKLSFQYEMDSRIKRPEEIIYKNGMFCGYVMGRAKGVTFNQYEEKLTINERSNLYKYATLHNNLEKVVKDLDGIVIPDLITCDNIFVDKNLGIELIDVDGFQIGDTPSPVISTSLGDSDKITSSKKYFDQNTRLFTKQLDIKSLIHLYFLDTFNVDLNKIGYMSPFTGRPITFNDLFEVINLDDWDVMDRVWKVFQENKQNEYLGDLVFDIAENYTMEVIPYPMQKNMYLKRLRRR